jgi:capsular exopolysaccharide synthesis family protein
MGRIADALKKAERDRSQATDTETLADRPPSSASTRLDRTNLGSTVEPAGRGLHLRTLRSGSPVPMTPPRLNRSANLTPPPPWDVHPMVVSAHDRSSLITEQYRAARTWLLRRNTTGKRSCIAVTSSVPREGKSVTTANLAVAMAEVRHMNVLAVDCDFRQGSLAKLFKLPNSPGLSDVLAGRAQLSDVITRTPLGNLSLLPAGTCQDLNPTELLNSTEAVRVFDEIRESYHYTLVDTPPVQWLSDVGVIGALCSGIVLVVRMNKTASHLVRQSYHWLQANNLEVLGCIAADCSAKGARYEYEDSGDE